MGNTVSKFAGRVKTEAGWMSFIMKITVTCESENGHAIQKVITSLQ